jgi:hypothetical protein
MGRVASVSWRPPIILLRDHGHLPLIVTGTCKQCIPLLPSRLPWPLPNLTHLPFYCMSNCTSETLLWMSFWSQQIIHKKPESSMRWESMPNWPRTLSSFQSRGVTDQEFPCKAKVTLPSQHACARTATTTKHWEYNTAHHIFCYHAWAFVTRIGIKGLVL